MTETQLALMRAVRANPDDDVPRMVYADWLEENGFAEWAGLIRCQVKLADPRRHVLMLAETNELMADHIRRMQSPTLLASIPGLAAMDIYTHEFDGNHNLAGLALHEFEQQDAWMRIHFCRGFVVGIFGPIADVRRYLPDLLRHHTIVDAVPTDVFGDGEGDRELPEELDLFIDRWVSAETLTDADMTNMPVYFSKVLIAEALERMANDE